MIVKMSKVYIVSGKGDRDRLLNALRDLGVVHLIPVDADTAVPDDKTIHQLDAMKRAIQILSVEQPSDAAPDIDAAGGQLRADTEGQVQKEISLPGIEIQHLEICPDIIDQQIGEAGVGKRRKVQVNGEHISYTTQGQGADQQRGNGRYPRRQPGQSYRRPGPSRLAGAAPARIENTGDHPPHRIAENQVASSMAQFMNEVSRQAQQLHQPPAPGAGIATGHRLQYPDKNQPGQHIEQNCFSNDDGGLLGEDSRIHISAIITDCRN